MDASANNVKKKKFKLKMKTKDNVKGFGFISLWIFGFLFVFGSTMLESVIYAFNNVSLPDAEETGMIKKFIGLDNFKQLLFGEYSRDFWQNMVNTLVDLAWTVPLIVLFSMFIAMILNQKFKGRTFFRAAFFMPVIVTSGAIFSVMMQGLNKNSLGDLSSSVSSTLMYQPQTFVEFLNGFGIFLPFESFFDTLSLKIVSTTWISGIQILLYLAGLQTIPQSYYEVSTIEGATKWETFWKITFPLISPFTLVVIVYSIIDSFTKFDNPLMQYANGAVIKSFYGLRSATYWIYFLICLIIMAAIAIPISRRVFYADEN